MSHELPHDGYLISDDRSRLDVDAIHDFLVGSYWATGIPRELVARSVENSLCLGVYDRDGRQVGLARVISDYATFAYLCDVYILEPHRGRGLAKAAMRAVMSHPRLQGLRRFTLGTRDAHRLYARFGFAPAGKPQNRLEKKYPHPYGTSEPC
jgi:GNAT superfamily N-acetyltransferase